jgi:hypothetical protein
MDKEEILDKAKDIVNKKMSNEARDGLYLNSKTKGILDAAQEKLVSRKLLVFLTATSLFIWAGLDPDTWGMIAMCYIGGQAAIDFAKVWKG